MHDDEAARRVAEALGHAFESLPVLLTALTHRSFANEKPKLAGSDNERLELLGDSVLGVAATELLFEAFPEAGEGELTRRRADLVCESSLAKLAAELGIGPAMRLGRGEERSGGRDKPRLLASALEACIGAVHADAGLVAAVEAARQLLATRLYLAAPGHRDFKSRAQEWVQARSKETPVYDLVRTEGPDHARVFHVVMKIGSEAVAEGSGRSKSEAEQAAARLGYGRLVELELAASVQGAVEGGTVKGEEQDLTNDTVE